MINKYIQNNKIQVYLVGGAVRNQLLKLPASDRDWVVVGATPNDLIKLGFQQVGKDFPVFLHPKTHEEYALARTEQKTGIGYTGFSCYTTPNITITEDLLRRDLTINAIAQDEHGHLIDPFHGKKDIKKRLLRHVSEAFIEDPLRILRVARIAAQLAKQKFTIANETQLLMKKMVQNHEINSISTERIWIETKKALQSSAPDIYFNILRNCGALDILFPEINQLFKIPFSEEPYYKTDIGTHTLLTLKIVTSLTDNIETRFAALCHDFDKASTPSRLRPFHTKYETQSVSLIERMCNRLRIPNKMKELAKLVAKLHSQVHKIDQLQAKNIINLFNKLDCWRKPERINQLITVCKADAFSLLKLNYHTYPQAKFVTEAFKKIQKLPIKNPTGYNIKGNEVKNEITKQRIQALDKWQQQQTILPLHF